MLGENRRDTSVTGKNRKLTNLDNFCRKKSIPRDLIEILPSVEIHSAVS